MVVMMEPNDENKTGSGRTVAFLEISCLLFGISAWVALTFNQIQPEPYMDEVFHVPQAKLFCEGKFLEWNPKITTPPGLYILSVGIIHPATELANYLGLKGIDLCSTFWLRSINLLFTVGNFYVLFATYKKLHVLNKDLTTARALSVALNLTLLPVLYFFTFLYYTDVGSVFFTLLMYLLHLHDSQMMSAAMGAVAVAFRQTNVVWVVFTAGSRVLFHLTEHVKTNTVPDPEDGRSNLEYLVYTAQRLLWHPHKSVASFLWLSLRSTFLYQVVIAAFLYAVLVWNHGSLVLGDHAAHEPTLNLPQLNYFLLFTGCFAFPYLFSYPKLIAFARHYLRRPLLLALLLALLSLSVALFTHVHPYLVSDNRHLPFYVWRRLYAAHWLVPYLLVPLQVFVLHSLATRLQVQNLWWKLLLAGCVAAACVPQRLLEFRYYLLPYLFLRLHMPVPNTYIKVALEFIANVTINVITIRLFWEKTFTWDDSPGLQRIMW